MWRCWSLALLGALPLVAMLGQLRALGKTDRPSPSPTPLGFAPAARAAELEAEAHALGVPTPENARPGSAP